MPKKSEVVSILTIPQTPKGSQGAGSISSVIIMSSLRDYDYFTPSGLPESGGSIHRYNNATPSGFSKVAGGIHCYNNVIPSGLRCTVTEIPR